MNALHFSENAGSRTNATLLVEKVCGGDAGYNFHADVLLLKDRGPPLVARRLSWPKASGSPKDLPNDVLLGCAKLWAEEELFTSGSGLGRWHLQSDAPGVLQGLGQDGELTIGTVVSQWLMLSRLVPLDSKSGEAVYDQLESLRNILFRKSQVPDGGSGPPSHARVKDDSQ